MVYPLFHNIFAFQTESASHHKEEEQIDAEIYCLALSFFLLLAGGYLIKVNRALKRQVTQSRQQLRESEQEKQQLEERVSSLGSTLNLNEEKYNSLISSRKARNAEIVELQEKVQSSQAKLGELQSECDKTVEREQLLRLDIRNRDKVISDQEEKVEQGARDLEDLRRQKEKQAAEYNKLAVTLLLAIENK